MPSLESCFIQSGHTIMGVSPFKQGHRDKPKGVGAGMEAVMVVRLIVKTAGKIPDLQEYYSSKDDPGYLKYL